MFRTGTMGGVHVVSEELGDDPTIDITTYGRRSGEPRRIEIWMMEIEGRYFITGTPGPRDWMANLRADPRLLVHLKRTALLDLEATASLVSDETMRRRVLAHPSARWYSTQESLEELAANAPMVEVHFIADPA